MADYSELAGEKDQTAYSQQRVVNDHDDLAVALADGIERANENGDSERVAQTLMEAK